MCKTKYPYKFGFFGRGILPEFDLKTPKYSTSPTKTMIFLKVKMSLCIANFKGKYIPSNIKYILPFALKSTRDDHCTREIKMRIAIAK